MDDRFPPGARRAENRSTAERAPMSGGSVKRSRLANGAQACGGVIAIRCGSECVELAFGFPVAKAKDDTVASARASVASLIRGPVKRASYSEHRSFGLRTVRTVERERNCLLSCRGNREDRSKSGIVRIATAARCTVQQTLHHDQATLRT